MEGKATFTKANGDTFKGSFKNNEFYIGTYTEKKTGSYFKGHFKDGNPDAGNGTWYSKRGKILH